MKRRLACVVLIGVCLVLMNAGPGPGAEQSVAKRSVIGRCINDVRIVLANSQVKVFRYRGRDGLWVCRANGRTARDLSRGGSQSPRCSPGSCLTGPQRVAIGGNWVVTGDSISGREGVTLETLALNVATGKVFSIPIDRPPFSSSGPIPRVSDVAVSAQGGYAFIEQTTDAAGNPSRVLRVADKSGLRELVVSNGLEAGSLTFARQRLYWTVDGQPASTTVGAA